MLPRRTASPVRRASGSGRDAFVQDIHLELLRRTRFNALGGEQGCASVLKHCRLWLAAQLDRPGVPNYAQPGRVPVVGLIELRDLPDTCWDDNTLFL
jgi:hypothetical protein